MTTKNQTPVDRIREYLQHFVPASLRAAATPRRGGASVSWLFQATAALLSSCGSISSLTSAAGLAALNR